MGILAEMKKGLLTNSYQIFQSPNSPLLIGIHARHGIDLTMHQRNQRYGHTVATSEYYKNAMEFFTKKIKNNLIIFLVISDNMSWAKRNIGGIEGNEKRIFVGKDS
ncbi:unnamed protein product [Meloidogyne enterolobii]|uniref:Uncharacterized protein n=1 Tax=Meloidogyne enterolobii TaxID=390850 RepID=A0ACB1ADF8_MELEN